MVTWREPAAIAFADPNTEMVEEFMIFMVQLAAPRPPVLYVTHVLRSKVAQKKGAARVRSK